VASVFAVVSKKVFETEARVAGKVLGLGGLWSTEKYKSTHAALQPLKSGGHLFLVTVRPPSEDLWLIAVLRDVKAAPDGWKSSTNTTRITDITSLKNKIRFATGTGITAAKGKLGMSLQTPRTLTDDDVKLLLAAGPIAGASANASANAPVTSAPAAKKIYHLNAHEKGPLPCLCAKCFSSAGERVVASGAAFVRREAHAKDRVLYYWLPEAAIESEKAVAVAVERRMRVKLASVRDDSSAKSKRKRRPDDDDDEDEDDE
jgi:hypothetical protein